MATSDNISASIALLNSVENELCFFRDFWQPHNPMIQAALREIKTVILLIMQDLPFKARAALFRVRRTLKDISGLHSDNKFVRKVQIRMMDGFTFFEEFFEETIIKKTKPAKRRLYRKSTPSCPMNIHFQAPLKKNGPYPLPELSDFDSESEHETMAAAVEAELRRARPRKREQATSHQQINVGASTSTSTQAPEFPAPPGCIFWDEELIYPEDDLEFFNPNLSCTWTRDLIYVNHQFFNPVQLDYDIQLAIRQARRRQGRLTADEEDVIRENMTNEWRQRKERFDLKEAVLSSIQAERKYRKNNPMPAALRLHLSTEFEKFINTNFPGQVNFTHID